MTDLPAIEAPREPATTPYHGVDVTDDYQWLENAADERTRSWTAAQDRRTRDYLGALPVRERIRRSVEEVLTVRSTTYVALDRRRLDVLRAQGAAPTAAAVPRHAGRRG